MRSIGLEEAIDPAQPDHIYAALEVGGAMRSLDGGETWEDGSADLVKLSELPHLKSRIVSDSEMEGMLDGHALCVSGAASGTVFLALRMGLFRSTDRAAHWQDMEVGRFSPLTYGRDIRVSPQDPRVLYACLSPAARSEDGSLYRSADLGETWSRFDHGVKAESTMMAVALHPRDADRVYCVSRTGQVFGTEDAVGQTISIGSRRFTVVGVGEKLGNQFVNDDDFIQEMEGMYMPLSTLRKFYSGEDNPVALLAVKTRDMERLGDLKSEVEASLKIAHRGAQDFKVSNVAAGKAGLWFFQIGDRQEFSNFQLSATPFAPDKLEASKGTIRVIGDAAKSLTWKQACAKLGATPITATGQRVPRGADELISSGVGGAQMAFEDVRDPASVQQDIDRRRLARCKVGGASCEDRAGGQEFEAAQGPLMRVVRFR